MDFYKRRTYRKKKGGVIDNEKPDPREDTIEDTIDDTIEKDPNFDPTNFDDEKPDPIKDTRTDFLPIFEEKGETGETGGYFKRQNNKGGNVLKNAFDDFLRDRANISGGANEEEVREGYDSFTIVKASAGDIGGRFISKTSYTAASKAASRLFKNTKSSTLTFVIQKITNGSNKRYYAYEATIKYLSKPMLIFKKDEDGNKIVMNTHGQVLRVNSNKKILNSSGSVKKDYNPKEKIASLTSFNYKPYIIKEVTKDITIKAIDVPEDLKEKQKEKAKAKMTEEQKEMMKQKKAEKKAREAAKKAADKEKEKARKEKERERARRQKEKEREQLRKEKLRNKKMMLKGGNGGMCSLNSCM